MKKITLNPTVRVLLIIVLFFTPLLLLSGSTRGQELATLNSCLIIACYAVSMILMMGFKENPKETK